MKKCDSQVKLALDRPVRRNPGDCPVEDWLDFLGHKWNALLLWHLADAAKRHSDLLALLPEVSQKVLAERLSALVQRGLIEKSASNTFPRTVTYALSEQGAKIVSILNQIEVWSKNSTSHSMPEQAWQGYEGRSNRN